MPTYWLGMISWWLELCTVDISVQLKDQFLFFEYHLLSTTLYTCPVESIITDFFILLIKMHWDNN